MLANLLSNFNLRQDKTTIKPSLFWYLWCSCSAQISNFKRFMKNLTLWRHIKTKENISVLQNMHSDMWSWYHLEHKIIVPLFSSVCLSESEKMYFSGSFKLAGCASSPLSPVSLRWMLHGCHTDRGAELIDADPVLINQLLLTDV